MHKDENQKSISGRKQKIKKIALVLAAAAVLSFAAALGNLFYGPLSFEKLDFVERFALGRTNKRLNGCLEKMPKAERKTIGYDAAMQCLNPIERKFVKRIFAINPAEIGFKGPFFSLEPAKDLVSIPDKEFDVAGEKYETGINYMPRPVFDDFNKMNEAMQNGIGKTLYVDSSYRSPGYQAVLFLGYLKDENQYSLKENARWVAMPGYSEHGSLNTAVDFINQDGVSGEGKGQTAEDFANLPEYAWLTENASKFNFYLTYPVGNPFGVTYEPWHWHWEMK